MGKKNLITRRLGIIIMGILIFCIGVIFLSMYRINYEEITKAAGVEAYGCANITTALVNPKDIDKIKAGDKETAAKVGDEISWTIQHKSIFEGQYIMDLDKKLLAVDENVLEQGFRPGDEFHISDEDLEQLKMTKAPVYSDVYEFGGMKRLTGYAPIFEDHNPDNEIVAISAIDFESSILHSRTWDMIKGSFIIAIIPILLAGVATIYLIKKTTEPLTTIGEFASRVAEGDLTVEDLDVKGNDEIAQLSSDLNTMAGNLRSIIGDLTMSSSQVATTSEELSASAEEVAVSAKQGLKSTEQVQVGSQDQVKIVKETNEIVATITEKIETMRERMEELTKASNTTSNKAEYGDQTIEESILQMEEINTKASHLSESVNQLRAKSEEINNIISIITGISERTNLLALNASIEASRAGESGQGFAVVASEIRSLSEQSFEATREISNLIHEIQSDTNDAANETNESIEAVKIGTEGIQKAGTAFNDIKKSIDEVTKEIHVINMDTTQISTDIERIVSSMENIESISNENALMTVNVLSQSEDETTSIQEITQLMETLSGMAEELNNRTHEFQLKEGTDETKSLKAD